ncbi:MAG: PSD1 and planctomycete cytochrome C domain-containing protein [Planctomycetes bacterium]|nr:PSD1 and planctomycete cytochrome C domain-containing protein [Planctomycetota bacterium]
MPLPVRSIFLVLFGCVFPSVGSGAEKPADLLFFESKIRPILVEHCYRCHSLEARNSGKLKANLFLDSRKGLLQGGESGPAVVVGNPGESLLIRSLAHQKKAPEMPSAGKLPLAVIADFEEWIRRGMPDPRTEKTAVVKKGMSIEEGRQFWSFIPPKIPDADRSRSTTDVVDRHIKTLVDKQGLSANREAARPQLIRRLSLDLIGLPPTPAEMDAFVSDSSPNALTALVDRLLDSPHFGERWGRHWLDAARYADSNGRDRNIFWYHAWRYRNYVIQSLNDDVPYDRFLQEQIAGDLLGPSSSKERDRLRIATGFLALGSKAFEEIKPEIFRMDMIDEQIDLIGRSVLGLSIACARCHDHKFDPIPTRDYYALAGILRSTQPLYGHGPTGIKATMHNHTPLWAVGADAEKLGETGLAYLERINTLTLLQNTARSDRYRVVRRLADAKLQVGRSGVNMEKLTADIDRMESEIKAWDVKVKQAEADLKAAMDTPPSLPGWAMGARDRSAPENSRVHVRGETTNLGPVVPRGVLEVLPKNANPIPADQSGRRQLAEWLTDRGNPLTARVHVNRVWLHLFGRGLVTSPDDLGVTGAKPSHPELLDFLAVRFMEEGWSTKKLIRALVLSKTYRQSTDANDANLVRDPDNIHLWRMSPRPLDVEVFRDAILAVSGQLERKPPTPEQEYLARLNPYHENEYRNFKPVFTPAQIEMPHRGIYLPVVRGVLPTMFQLFDFASPDRPIAQREESTVPAQSLYLMNNPWILEQARHTAKDLLSLKEGGDAERIKLLYRRAFARVPSPEESESALRFLSETESLLPPAKGKPMPTREQVREERWVSFCQVIFASAEFRVLR